MRALPVSVFAFVLCACAQQPTINIDALQTTAKITQYTYLSCMDTAAKVYATASISAIEAGIAAQGHCSVEFTQFELATRNFMVGSVTGLQWQTIAAERARLLAAETKRKAQESVVAKVVEHRMLQGTPKPSKEITS